MKLHLGNLSKETTEAQLKDLVTPFGETTMVELAKDPGGQSKGFGFAEFKNDEQAKAAMAGLDGKEVGGQTIKVGEARPRKSEGRTAPSSTR